MRTIYRLLWLTVLLAACSTARPPVSPPAAGPPRVILDGWARPLSKAERKAKALLVVDGVPSPQRVLYDLAPSNIDSTRVMKPAQAVLRYGTAGHNGALLIYTKKGRR